jgi:hypothetical protein
LPEEFNRQEYGYRYIAGEDYKVRVISQPNEDTDDPSVTTDCLGGNLQSTVTILGAFNSLMMATSIALVSTIMI